MIAISADPVLGSDEVDRLAEFLDVGAELSLAA
jgi:hypothetical protein